MAIRLKTDFFFFFLTVSTIPNHFPQSILGPLLGKDHLSLPLALKAPRGAERAQGLRAPFRGSAGTWLTFVGRLWAQFPGAAEDAADEQDEDGEVTIHVAGAPGSERSISPRSMPLI